MATVFFNTLGKKKQEFRPLKKGIVGIYTCGPTVYNYLHIGNYKASVFYDLVKRYFIFKGYKVRHIENITDVEDKIIKTAREQNIDFRKLTQKFIDDYLETKKKLRLLKPEKQPRATEYIPQMVDLVKKLLKKGIAYKSPDGSIYFSIKKFPAYGKLSGIKKDELIDGKRVSSDEYEKEKASDFALWKAWGEEDGNVFWETEIGKGRPGWHIECSAMSVAELGSPFDIHAGGEDLVFPHHENEIAQSEAAYGKKFVNYWMHEAHLLVDGKKMSKSLGNFFTFKDLENYNPLAIKLELMVPHYRSQMNFTKKGIEEKEKVIERANSLIKRLLNANGKENPKAKALSEKFLKAFEKALDDDLNTPQAFLEFFSFQSEINKLLDSNSVSKKDAKEILSALKKFDSVFAFMDFEGKKESLSKDLLDLIKKREQFRKEKKFAESDAIRKQLAEKGIILTDNKDGTTSWENSGQRAGP